MLVAPGLRLDGLRSSASRRARRILLDPLMRRYGSPTAERLLHVGGAAHLGPGQALRALLATPDVGDSVRPDFERRWGELRARIETARARRVRPAYYDVERLTAELLYTLVRTVRPSVVAETGVANGVSSYVLASALLDNGGGVLCSIDVRPDVGPFMSPRERQVWELVVLPRSGRRRSLERALDDLGPLDLFLHDSHHSYGWQMAEYESASARLRPGGVLASDDVDASFAFATFCERHGLRAEFLFDGRKFFGAARRPGDVAS